jgi:hypothetical protein
MKDTDNETVVSITDNEEHPLHHWNGISVRDLLPEDRLRLSIGRRASRATQFLANIMKDMNVGDGKMLQGFSTKTEAQRLRNEIGKAVIEVGWEPRFTETKDGKKRRLPLHESYIVDTEETGIALVIERIA